MDKQKTIKISWITHDRLSFLKENAKAERKENVSFDEMIMAGLRWRDAVKPIETDAELRFNIGFYEFRDNMKEFEVGIYPVLNYADPEYVNMMIEPDRVVIHDETIRVLFSYPFSHTVEETCNKEGGFSRANILKIVGDGYKKIYDEEAKTMKTVSESRFRENRGCSDGVHGVYGHIIDDLWLEFLVYEKKTGILRLGIGS